MSLILLALACCALSRRYAKKALEPKSRWGKDRLENPLEVFVCAMESVLWIVLGSRSISHTASDLTNLISVSSFGLCFVGALMTCLDVASDTLFDTLRRLISVVVAVRWRSQVALLMAAGGIAYRVMRGMGVADNRGAWWSESEQLKQMPREKKLKVLVLSIGTRGDVQPFIYLGQEMRSRGHEVTICALDKYRDLVERNGLLFKRAGIDDIEESKFWRKCRHVSEVMADSIPNFCMNFLKIGSALFDAASGSNADVLVVTSTAQSIALSISNKLNIPTFVVKFAPDVPTRSFPAPGYEGKRSLAARLVVPSAVYNLASWYHHWLRIGLASIKCKLGDVENKYRKEVLELEALQGGTRLKEMTDCPNLCAFSNVVVPTPRDWPGNCLVSGWWLPPRSAHFEEARDGGTKNQQSVSPSSSATSVASSSSSTFDAASISSSSCSDESHHHQEATPAESNTQVEQKKSNGEILNDDVLAFVGQKRDVVCVTFGSMSPTADALGLLPLVLRACENVFGRDTKVLVVGARFASFENRDGQRRIKVIDEAPYNQLFPLVRIVVHHGGAGTSASCLETCVPSLIIPILVWTDQPLWASQLELLGVGHHVEQQFAFCPEDDPVRRRFLDEKFAADCEHALSELTVDSVDPKKVALRERVAKLVGEENGVVRAADAIEYVLSRSATRKS